MKATTQNFTQLELKIKLALSQTSPLPVLTPKLMKATTQKFHPT
jgi:hypothetical protein